MFNRGKTNGVKEEASNLVGNVKDSATDIARDVKKSAKQIENKAIDTMVDSKAEILTLIGSLKALLADTDYAGNARHMKDQVLAKADEWRQMAADEISHVTDVSVVKTRSVVREQPLVSVGVAIGAGLLIGYILGHKSSSK